MATIKILLGIICLAFIGSSSKHSGNFVKQQHNKQKQAKIITLAQAQLGQREKTGNNDGPQIEAYQKYTGNKRGDPWCASFVSWIFAQAGYGQPRTAWSPALFPKVRLKTTAEPAQVFGIYFPNLNRIAHCGLVEKQQGNWLITIEGNTNITGSREGDGVYRKFRHRKTIKFLADWLEKKGLENGK